MAKNSEIAICFIHGIKRKEKTYKVKVTDAKDPDKKDAIRWMPKRCKEGSSIEFVESRDTQEWKLSAQETSGLWSFHIKSGRDALYVSYNTKGEVTLQKEDKSKESNKERDFEKYFKFFLEKDGGVTLTSRHSNKIILCVQHGILVMSNGTKSMQVSCATSQQELEQEFLQCCATGSGADSQSDIKYIVEVDDPDESGKKWSSTHPIRGGKVELAVQNDSKWSVRIDGGNWTFQPNGHDDYFASMVNDYVEFETASNQTSQFSVSRHQGAIGVYISGGQPPSQKFVGKQNDILQLENQKTQAVGWNLNVLYFVFKTKRGPGQEYMEVLFPTPAILPAQ